MKLSLTIMNTICTDLGGVGSHRYEIQALNEMCTLLGGVGAHRYNIDALNELCTLQGVTSGHALNIRALNALSSGSFRYECDAYESIQQGGLLNVSVDIPMQMKISNGTILDDMEALTGWAKGGTGTMELNDVEKYAGTNSIKVTTGAGAQCRISKSITRNFSSDNAISFSVKAYAHTNPSTTIAGVTIFAATNSSLTDYFATYIEPLFLVQNQWVDLDIRKMACQQNGDGWVVAAGNPNWANITYLRIVTTGASGQVGIVSYDQIEHGADYKATVMIHFDDGNISDYTKAFPYLKAKKMVATCNIISSYTSEAYLTPTQMQALNAAKWDIGNHTSDHTDLTTLATEAEIIAKFQDCETFLNNLGLNRASKQVAYPFANTNALVLQAMATYGALTGRGSGNGYNGSMTYAYNYPYTLATLSGINVATVKSMLDHAKKYKVNLTILYHDLADATAFANFCEVVDYIETLGLQTLTVNEFYRLYSNPITVNHL